MKGGTVQISWHEGKPVLTLDFHPPSATLATAGADFDIKVPPPSSFCFASTCIRVKSFHSIVILKHR